MAGERVWRRLGAGVVAAAAMALGGCSDDPSDPSARDLVGAWSALEYEYTSDAEPAESYDLIVDGGGTYSIELIVDGRYQWTLNALSGTTTGSGSYAVSGGRLILTPAGGGAPTVFERTFNGIFLTLVDDEAEWDFDGDGTAEAAELRVVLDRT